MGSAACPWGLLPLPAALRLRLRLRRPVLCHHGPPEHWPANRYGLKLRDAIFIEDYSCLEALEAGWIAEEQLP